MVRRSCVLWSLLSAVLVPVREVVSQNTCGSSTCYGFDCDYWVTENGATCTELEETAGCNCDGCECGGACPSTCLGETCDTWTLQGVACSDLESNFGCVCTGCVCADPITQSSSVSPNKATNAPATTTVTERVFSNAPDVSQFTGTVPLEVVHTTTEINCPPGHICNFGNPTDPPTVTTSCVTNFLQDDFCDDENNNAQCDWDGGDCCGAEISTLYCTECDCLDPTYSAYYNCGNATCPQPAWQDDNYCDDENNICSCNWDGGDCCGSDKQYNYCSECKCKDIMYDDATCHAGCATKAYVGDDFCDDENNNCGCDWDGGDCCGANKHSTYCDICACLDPDAQHEADSVNCVMGCDQLTHYADGFVLLSVTVNVCYEVM